MKKIILIVAVLGLFQLGFAADVIKHGNDFYIKNADVSDTAVINHFYHCIYTMKIYETMLKHDCNYSVKVYGGNVKQYGTVNKEGKFKSFKIKKCLELAIADANDSFKEVKDKTLRNYMAWKFFTTKPHTAKSKKALRLMQEEKKLVAAFAEYLYQKTLPYV